MRIQTWILPAVALLIAANVARAQVACYSEIAATPFPVLTPPAEIPAGEDEAFTEPTYNVTTEAELQSAITAAPDGARIVIQNSLDNMEVYVPSKRLLIEGAGPGIICEGTDGDQINPVDETSPFELVSANVVFRNLIIRGGRGAHGDFEPIQDGRAGKPAVQFGDVVQPSRVRFVGCQVEGGDGGYGGCIELPQTCPGIGGSGAAAVLSIDPANVIEADGETTFKGGSGGFYCGDPFGCFFGSQNGCPAPPVYGFEAVVQVSWSDGGVLGRRDFGDLDASGCTDLDDFLILLDQWLEVLDGSEVNIDDFLNLLDNWQTGSQCGG